MYTFYNTKVIIAQCGSVQLFATFDKGEVSYELIDLDIKVEQDIIEQIVDCKSSLKQYQSYCIGKYGVHAVWEMKGEIKHV